MTTKTQKKTTTTTSSSTANTSKKSTSGLIVSNFMNILAFAAVCIGGIAMFLATIFALVAPQLLKYVIAFEGSECCGVSLSVYGFSLTASYVNQKIDTLTFVLFGIGATAIFLITALIFANLNKLFQNSCIFI